MEVLAAKPEFLRPVLAPSTLCNGLQLRAQHQALHPIQRQAPRCGVVGLHNLPMLESRRHMPLVADLLSIGPLTQWHAPFGRIRLAALRRIRAALPAVAATHGAATAVLREAHAGLARGLVGRLAQLRLELCRIAPHASTRTAP